MQQDDLKTRKRDHLVLCETDAVAFKEKSSGFERYDFLHYAITEVRREKIAPHRKFFAKQCSLPFMVSSMTGGTSIADSINLELAEACRELNIPLGLGSLRYALDDRSHDDLLAQIRKLAGGIPLLANIGAAQIIEHQKNFSPLISLVDLIEADAFIVHVNPVQEMLQKDGQPEFFGLLSALEKFARHVKIPVIVKEVGSGISREAAKELFSAGVRGIDTAGAGGTSWAGVEILRNDGDEGNEFWDWGLPSSYCVRTVAKLKEKHQFLLIGSGGIASPFDAAKAIALGADFAAAARPVLQKLREGGIDGVIGLFRKWGNILADIMYLTGCQSLNEFNRDVLTDKKDLY